MGRIKSTVLYHCGGVITEERFQKMTLVQWIFHYKMIISQRVKEAKIRDEIIKSVAGGSIDILDRMMRESSEFTAFFLNPKMYHRYLEDKKEKDEEKAKNPDTKGQPEEQLSEKERLQRDFDLLMGEDVLPNELKIELADDSITLQGNKKISKRMIGIQKR